MEAEENTKAFHGQLQAMFESEVKMILNTLMIDLERVDADLIVKELVTIYPIDREALKNDITNFDRESLENRLSHRFISVYKSQRKKYGDELWTKIVQLIFLSAIDKYWTEHLTAINDLREGIGLRGYAQLDPLNEYKNEAFSMFEKLLSDIDYEVVRRVLRVEADEQKHEEGELETQKKMQFQSASSIDPFSQQNKKPQKNGRNLMSGQTSEIDLTTLGKGANPSKRMDQSVGESSDQVQEIAPGIKLTPPGKSKKKPGRNDPCWCGSGKKYKKCHYPN
jgi:preprotein translocase subunit SecA